ncbi:hypothetical protein MMC10_001586 [Thelotrema lepadinum]|nr:hypothetical protein [Thelotrema lepadinum]
MLTFDDLPFEIVNQIVHDVDDTADLCSLSMTCYRVMKMADGILSQRRRAFRIGFNQEPYPAQPGEDFGDPYPPSIKSEDTRTLSIVESYLLSICRQRKLALLPKLLVIGGFRSILTRDSLGPREIAEEDIRDIRSACKYLGMEKAMRNTWIEGLKNGEAWLYIRLIVLLLPNLRVISIRNDGVPDDLVIPWTPPQQHSLKNLETVTISGPPRNDKALSLAWPFLFQKSIRKFYCVGSGGCVLSLAKWPDRTSPSDLANLYFNHCFIADDILEDLFRHTPNLKSLTYYPEYQSICPEGSTQHQNTYEGLNKALSFLAGNLQLLQLSILSVKVPDGTTICDPDAHWDASMLDFSKFLQLRTVRINCHLILPSWSNEPSSCSAHLTKVFPQSLEAVSLLLTPKGGPTSAVHAHVRNLLGMRRMCPSYFVPKLRSIAIFDFRETESSTTAHSSAVWQELMKLGKDVGVQVIVKRVLQFRMAEIVPVLVSI